MVTQIEGGAWYPLPTWVRRIVHKVKYRLLPTRNLQLKKLIGERWNVFQKQEVQLPSEETMRLFNLRFLQLPIAINDLHSVCRGSLRILQLLPTVQNHTIRAWMVACIYMWVLRWLVKGLPAFAWRCWDRLQSPSCRGCWCCKIYDTIFLFFFDWSNCCSFVVSSFLGHPQKLPTN